MMRIHVRLSCLPPFGLMQICSRQICHVRLSCLPPFGLMQICSRQICHVRLSCLPPFGLMQICSRQICAIILASLLISNEVQADIYKFIANDGSIYYTDKPKNSLYKRIIRTRPVNYAAALPYMGSNRKRFADLITEAANRHQVDVRLVHAVIQAESAYNARAISTAGAVGLMQLMPDTARRYGVVNRNDPVQNIDGGTHYLKDLLRMFNSNLDLAVAAYNAGEGAVMRYHNSIPPYPETRNYVKTVMALYNRRS
ncbi:lytic transglycosylase domain-containing protein [Methylobacter svalbardensis]|uniref:lytic transglycosylase domain-containing protein n=1 Tax=Methylobacter svalbardensis TaxID=3080016 RepID=UPI003BB68E0F